MGPRREGNTDESDIALIAGIAFCVLCVVAYVLVIYAIKGPCRGRRGEPSKDRHQDR
jgi:hypothetical protein